MPRPWTSAKNRGLVPQLVTLWKVSWYRTRYAKELTLDR